MKNLLLFCLTAFFVFSASLNAQIRLRKPFHATASDFPHKLQRYGASNTQSVSGILREGFENTSFPPAGWQAVNVFGPEVWLRSNIIVHNGLASAFCLYEQGAAYGEDWLIMPKFNVVASDSLHFWMGITDPGWPDSLYVLVSTTDSALSSFTNKELILSDGNGYPTVHHGWIQKNISLAAYAGQSIYIAFRNWNINGDGVGIDDVELGTPPSADAAAVSWDKPHILGDTAQTPIATVKNVGAASQTFNVTMTITGGYTSTQTVTALAANTSKQISFASWTPNVIGTNIVKMYTQLAGDGYLLNDTLIDTLHISHISNDDIKGISIDMRMKTGDYAQTPKATIRNNGFNTESFNITMTISGGYSSTVPVTNLAPFTTQQISFASWTPTIIGNNNIKVYSQLATDADKTNDTLKTTIKVYQAFTNYGWSAKPNMSNQYYGNASAFYHKGTYPTDTSIVFSLGGFDNSSAFSNTNTAYSSLTNSWSALTQTPLARYQSSAQTVNGKIYLLGGFDPSFTPVKRNDIYNIATDSWNAGANMPEALGDFASAVYKDSLIFVIGGWDSLGAFTNAVRIYDTYNNTWTNATSKIGVATYGLRCGIYQNKIVVVGGHDGTNLQSQAALGLINASTPSAIVWSALPNYPGNPIMRHSAGSVFKDELPLIIFTAGDTAGHAFSDTTNFINETWGYDLFSNSWKIGPDKITGTKNNCNFVGAVFNDSLYMISVGGYGSKGALKVNEWLNLGPDTSHVLGVQQINYKTVGLGVYPNPFNDKTTISLTLDKEQKVSICIFDIHGRFIAELCNKNLSEGDHALVWNSIHTASGVYMIRAVIGNSVVNKKLIKN